MKNSDFFCFKKRTIASSNYTSITFIKLSLRGIRNEKSEGLRVKRERNIFFNELGVHNDIKIERAFFPQGQSKLSVIRGLRKAG